MEHPIIISNLNDFLFCPISIYFHGLEEQTHQLMYQKKAQLMGSHSHEKVDNAEYSDKKAILQGITVYSSEYNLTGKIDVFDSEKGILTERKRTIIKVYDGYIMQLYAQYFGLIEMGYQVNSIRLYSLSNNKMISVELPSQDTEMFDKFKRLLVDINEFDATQYKQTNVEKCKHCIYEELCYYSLIKE